MPAWNKHRRLALAGLAVAWVSVAALQATAQTWQNLGTQPPASGIPSVGTGHYMPSSGSPNMRGQQPVLYDALDKKIMVWFADAIDRDAEWGDSQFLYDPATNTWAPAFYSLITQANSNGQANVQTISRTIGVTTVTVGSNNGRSFEPGWTVLIQGVSDPSFNGQFQVTSASNCDSSGTLCTTFTYDQSGSPDSNPGTQANATVSGPADVFNIPLPRHNEGWVYDTKRNAIWDAMGVADVVSNATNIIGVHAASMDLYEMTFNSAVANHWSWKMICGFGTVSCSSDTSGVTNGIPCPTTSTTANCAYKFEYGGYDPTNDVYVIFGGFVGGGPQAETILYYPSTNSWEDVCGFSGLPVCGPPAREAQGDSRLPAIGNGNLFLFGGTANTNTPCGSGLSAALDDTWIFNTGTKTWTQVNSTVSPPCAVSDIFDYDPVINRVVLIDGNPSGARTWLFDPATNQWSDAGYPNGPYLEVTPNAPPLNSGAYDPTTNQMVVFALYNTSAVNPPCTVGSSPCTVIYALNLPKSTTPNPAVDFSPSSLAFLTQSMGTTSSPQSVTLTNTGDATLNITTISVIGTNASDFAETNNCPVSLAAGSNCLINVTFTPSMTSSERASVRVADNATDNPQAFALSGNEATTSGPAVDFSPSSLAFLTQSMGTTSSPQSVTLKNTGNATLNITTISVIGTNASDFAETNNCPASLAAGSNCLINVTFTPSMTGSESASVRVADNATDSPQAFALSGNGATTSSPSVNFSASSVNFSTRPVGTTSSPQSVTLKNTGNATLNITTISVIGTNASDFAETNNCPASLAVGSNCLINVTFTPSMTSSESASVRVADNASNSPQTLTLSGNESTSTPDFSLAAASGANCPTGGNCSTTTTISAGQSATYDLQVSPAGGFSGTVALSCSGAPAQATCTVAPSSVTVSGTSNSAFTVTVSTTAGSLAMPFTQMLRGRPWCRAPSELTLWLACVGGLMLGWLMNLAVGDERTKRALMSVVVLCFMAALLNGCTGLTKTAGVGSGGGGGTSGTPPGTTTLTVRGSSGTITHSVDLTSTVN